MTGTQSLDEAQAIKLDLICRRLELAPGDRVLDVGGGWGEFARHAATHFGCHVTSINIADEQIRHARELCAGLPVEIVKCDYRDLSGSFDKVAVIAMLTHVGPRNYRSFMSIVHDRLAPGGRVLIETLGSRISKVNCEPWTNTYIFPGGVVPSMRQLDRAADGAAAPHGADRVRRALHPDAARLEGQPRARVAVARRALSRDHPADAALLL